MRYYENLFIVHPNHEQEKLTNTIEDVKKEISNLDGNILNLEDWGKRRLAYPIEKQKYGTYVLIQYESENSKINRELENWMKIKPEILSYLVTALKEKPEVREKSRQEPDQKSGE